MRITFALTLLLMGLSGATYAGVVTPAPEIDPAAAVGALSLIGGAMLILRTRKRR